MYKLLIVEDEDMLREALMAGVDWAGLGYEARGAGDGEQALALALTFRPDIVLTDIRMPFMDGLQLCAKLREALPGTMVAILSGHDEFAYAQEALSWRARIPAKARAAGGSGQGGPAARAPGGRRPRARAPDEPHAAAADQAMPLMRQKLLTSCWSRRSPRRKSRICCALWACRSPARASPCA